MGGADDRVLHLRLRRDRRARLLPRVRGRGAVVTAQIIQFPIRDDVKLSKRRLALHYRRSVRWVEMQVAAGMPSHMEGGRRMIFLRDADEWLARRSQSDAG